MSTVRVLTTLTDREIIELINFLFPRTKSTKEGGDSGYRKIEVRLQDSVGAVEVRITYKGVFTDDPISKAAFAITTREDDISIDEYSSANSSKKELMELGITGNFVHMHFKSIKAKYDFCNESLHFWNPERGAFINNPSIGKNWTVIEEFSEQIGYRPLNPIFNNKNIKPFED